jgi:hypothetical protein
MTPADRTRPISYASVPTRGTRFMRTFVPYQLLRFTIINVKMLRLLSRAHHTKPRR